MCHVKKLSLQIKFFHSRFFYIPKMSRVIASVDVDMASVVVNRTDVPEAFELATQSSVYVHLYGLRNAMCTPEVEDDSVPPPKYLGSVRVAQLAPASGNLVRWSHDGKYARIPMSYLTKMSPEPASPSAASGAAKRAKVEDEAAAAIAAAAAEPRAAPMYAFTIFQNNRAGRKAEPARVCSLLLYLMDSDGQSAPLMDAYDQEIALDAALRIFSRGSSAGHKAGLEWLIGKVKKNIEARLLARRESIPESIISLARSRLKAHECAPWETVVEVFRDTDVFPAGCIKGGAFVPPEDAIDACVLALPQYVHKVLSARAAAYSASSTEEADKLLGSSDELRLLHEVLTHDRPGEFRASDVALALRCSLDRVEYEAKKASRKAYAPLASGGSLEPVADIEDLFEGPLARAPPCVRDLRARMLKDKHLQYQGRLDYSAALLDLGGQGDKIITHMARAWGKGKFESEFKGLCIKRKIKKSRDSDGDTSHLPLCRFIIEDDAKSKTSGGISCPYASAARAARATNSGEQGAGAAAAAAATSPSPASPAVRDIAHDCLRMCARDSYGPLLSGISHHTSVKGFGKRASLAGEVSREAKAAESIFSQNS